MIPDTTKVWHYANIYDTAKIGENCKIGSYVEIGENVIIGNNCSIGARSFFPEGVRLEDHVFVGPNVTFTNDRFPPSEGTYWKPILVKQFASIGAGSVIAPGVTIGLSAVIGAGSVVTKDVEDHAIVFGNPAVRKGTKKPL